jgi:hypothetical protein
MPGKTPTPHQQKLTEAEKAVFLRHMAFRFLLSLWAIYALLTAPLDKGLVTVFFLSIFLGIGETIFGSLMGWARIRANNEAKRAMRLAAEAKKQEAAANLKNAQVEASAKYFDLSPEAMK